MDPQCNANVTDYKFVDIIEGNDTVDLLYDKPETVMTIIVMPCILAIGLLGNLSFLLVVFRLKNMRTVVNVYLSSLAVSDTLFLLSGIGGKLFRYMYSPIGFNDIFLGDIGCILLHGFKDWCYYTSIASITLISLDRYLAICHPLIHRRIQTKWRAIKFITTSWAIGFCLSGVLAFAHCNMIVFCIEWPPVKKYVDYPTFMGVCVSINDAMNTAATIIQSVPFLITMILNYMLYCAIVYTVYANREKDEFSLSTDPNRSSRNRMLVTRMLVANGVIFFVCLAPFEITHLVVFADPTPQMRQSYRNWLRVCRALMYLNSATNPYIYSVTNPRYRHAFQQVFLCKKESKYQEVPRPPQNTKNLHNANSYLRLLSDASVKFSLLSFTCADKFEMR